MERHPLRTSTWISVFGPLESEPNLANIASQSNTFFLVNTKDQVAEADYSQKLLEMKDAEQ